MSCKLPLLALTATSFLLLARPLTAQGSDLRCLVDVDMTLKRGEVVGRFEGAGAGKSTLLMMLGRWNASDRASALAELEQALGRDPAEAVPAGRCIGELLDLFGSGGRSWPQPPGKSFDPGYLIFDWNDNGAMAPLLGVSSGLPIAAGIVPDNLTGMSGATDLNTLLVAYDPSESDIGANIGTATAPNRDSGAGVAEATAVGRDMANPSDAVPAVSALRPLGSVSVSLFDNTGDSTFELNCTGDVRAFRFGQLGEAAARNLLALRTLARRVEVLLLACPGGFRVY